MVATNQIISADWLATTTPDEVAEDQTVGCLVRSYQTFLAVSGSCEPGKIGGLVRTYHPGLVAATQTTTAVWLVATNQAWQLRTRQQWPFGW